MFNKLAIFIPFLLAGCAGAENNSDLHDSDEIDNYLNVIHFAHYIKVLESSQDTIVHLINPDDSTAIEKFILSSNGKKLKKGYTPIKTTGNSLITTSSTVIGMLSVLQMEDRIVGVLNKNYINNKKVLNRLDQGLTIEIHNADPLPVERVVSVSPDLIVYSSGYGADINNKNQLQELGIEPMALFDWREKHPLGKAEWIILFGYLTGKPDEAKAYMASITEEYERLCSMAANNERSPVVMAGNVFGDVWNAPTGESYVATIMKNAGADYIYKETKGTGSLKLSLEKIVKDSRSADIWINPGVPSKSSLLNVNPKAKYLTPFKKDAIYCYSHDINRFWEMSAIQPHYVLSDYIQLFQNESTSEDSLYFYRKITE